MPACARSRMFDYVYTDHAQYTIKTYAKMALFPLVLTGPLSVETENGRVSVRGRAEYVKMWRAAAAAGSAPSHFARWSYMCTYRK